MLTNVAVVEIATPGPLAANGDPSGHVVAWGGAVAGYLTRARRQTISGGEVVYVLVDRLVMLAAVAAPLLDAVTAAGAVWEAATVLIEDRRAGAAACRRFTVRGVDLRAAGTPVDSLRLDLDPTVTA